MTVPPSVCNRGAGSPQVEIAGQVVYTRSAAVVSRAIAGETIVVPICRGVGDLDCVYTFNALGSQLWQELSEARSVEELVARVTQSFDVRKEQALADVESFVRELLKVGLIHNA
jgi:hypothetical protein